MRVSLKKAGLSLFVAAATLLWTTCDVGLGDSVDTMAPTISINSPVNSDVCAGTIALNGDCADDKGVAAVILVVTNVNTNENFVGKVKAATLTSWDTTVNELAETAGFALKDGSYTVDATAVDIFGRTSGTASTAFDIDNTAPLFCVTSPATLEISNPRQYGRSVTISGEIADDHDIEKMNIRVFRYANGGSTEITDSLAKTEFRGFETAGGTTVYVAKYFDEAPSDTQSEDYKLYQNYMAIYGNVSLGTDVFVYIVPTLTDIAGNTSQACFLSSELKNLAAEICQVAPGLDSLQTAQLMKIYNGTYTLNEFNDEQKGKINSLLNGTYQLKDGQKPYYSRYVDGDATQQSPLAACVNPDNAPTYEFNGYENPVTSPNGWVGVNTGGNLTLTVKAGRDGWGILPGSITVNLYNCDASGNKTLAVPAFSSKNELDPTGAATVIVRDATNKEIANIETSVTNQSYYVTLPALRAGNHYLIEATGKDENDSDLVASRGNTYGFMVASSITPPKLSASDLFYVAGAGAKADGGCSIRIDIKDDSDEVGTNGVTVDAYLCKDHIAAKSYINAYIADKTPTKTLVYKNAGAQTIIKPAVDESGKETPNRYWFDLAVKDFAFNIEDNSHYTVVLCARAAYKDSDGNLVEASNTNFMFWVDNKAPAISIASPDQDGKLIDESFASYDSESSSITFSGNWNDLGGANTHRMWWTDSDLSGTPSLVWTPCAADEKFAAKTYYYKKQFAGATSASDCYALLDTENFVAGETSVAGYYKLGIASSTGGAWTEMSDVSQVASLTTWEQKTVVAQGSGKFFRLVGVDAVGNLSAPVERKDLTYDFEVPSIALTSEPASTGYYNISHLANNAIMLYYTASDSYQINAADVKVTAQKWNAAPTPPAVPAYEPAGSEKGFSFTAAQGKDAQGNDDPKKVLVTITLSTNANGAAIDIDGKWKWTVEAKDAAGRAAQSVSLERTVDTKAPVFQAFKDKVITDESGATTTRPAPDAIKGKKIAVGSGDWSTWTNWEDVWYYAAGLVFNGNLEEEGSGLAKISYELKTPKMGDSDPKIAGETTDLRAEFGSAEKPIEFVLNAIGFEESERQSDRSLKSNSLWITATDKAGNVSAAEQLTINIDQSQPAAAAAYYTYTAAPTAADLAVAEGTLVSDGTKTMTVYGSLSNDLSGVKELSWSVKPSDGSDEKTVAPKLLKYTTDSTITPTVAKPRADAADFIKIDEDNNWQDYSAIADKSKITGWKAVLIPAEDTSVNPSAPKSLYSGDHYITAYSASGKNSKNPVFTVDRDDKAPTIALNNPVTRPVDYWASNGGEIVRAKYFDAAPADQTSEEYKQYQNYIKIFNITDQSPALPVHSVNGTINISGITDDNKELDNVKVYWSKDPTAAIDTARASNPDNELPIGDSKSYWSFDYNFSSVKDGKFEFKDGSPYNGTPQTFYIKVAASDKAQNQTITVYEYSVNPDSDRPVITFIMPNDLSNETGLMASSNYILKEQSALIKGRVEDDDGLDGLAMFYNDNGETVSQSDPSLKWNDISITSGLFEVFNDAALRDGKHKLLFKVVDAKGTEFITGDGTGGNNTWLRPKVLDTSAAQNVFGANDTGDSSLYIQIDTQKPEISPVYYYEGKNPPDPYAAASAEPPTDPIKTLPTNFDGKKVGGTSNKFSIYVYARDTSGLDKDKIEFTFNDKTYKKGDANYPLEIAEAPSASAAYPAKDGWILIIAKNIAAPDKNKLLEGKTKGELKVYDNAGLSDTKEVSVTVDNKAPTATIANPAENSSQLVSGSVNAYGSVKDADDGTKLYYGLSFVDDTHNETAATTEPFDLPKNLSTEETVKYVEINRADNYLMWYVYFDSDSKYDDTGNKTHSYIFNQYLINMGASVGGVSATGSNISDGSFKKDTGIPIYLWIKAVDSVGNESVQKWKILHDPQGNMPTISFSYPAKNAETLGDSFSFYGVAKANDTKYPTVKFVFAQIISKHHKKITKKKADGTEEVVFDPAGKNFGRFTYSSTTSDPNQSVSTFNFERNDALYLKAAGYRLFRPDQYINFIKSGSSVEEALDAAEVYGEDQVDGNCYVLVNLNEGANVSWSIKLNSKGEFKPNPDDPSIEHESDKKINEVAIRVKAFDGMNFSLPETKWFKVDSETPTVSNVKVERYNGGNLEFSTGYKDNLCVTGNCDLTLDVNDGGAVGLVEIGIGTSESGAKNNPVTYFERVYDDKTGAYVVKKNDSNVVTCSENYDKVSVKYDMQTGNGCGTKYVYVHYEDNSANEGSKIYKITYDNTPPVLAPVTDSKYAIHDTIQQKDGWHSFGSKVTEAPVTSGGVTAEQSGFARVVFYFVAKNPSGEIAVCDPMLYNKSVPVARGDGLEFNMSFENGIYWQAGKVKPCADNPNAFEFYTTLYHPEFVHVGGLVKIGGYIYTIKGVNGDIYTLDGEPTFDQEHTDTNAFFAFGNVVDNPIQESETGSRIKKDSNFPNTSYGFGYCSPHPVNDDGDLMMETLINDGSNWNWTASIYSKNLVDGKVDIHYVAFDKAGNWAQAGGNNSSGSAPEDNPPVVEAKVSNNRLRLANIYVGTDLNGDDNVGGKDEANNKHDIYDWANGKSASGEWSAPLTEQSYIWNQDKNSGTAKTDTPASEGVAFKPAATRGSIDKAYLMAKGKTIIRPEFLGGIGFIDYKYEFYTNEEARSESPTPFIGGPLVEGRYISGESEVSEPFENEKARSQDITIQVGDFEHLQHISGSEKGIPDCDDDKPHKLRFKFNDANINEAVTVDIYMSVSMNDIKPPVITRDELYWTGKGEGKNSVAWDGSTPLGHIDLSADLPSDFTDPAPSEAKTIKGTAFPAALMDRDSKVSGKIVLRGSVRDNKMLKYIYLNIPQMAAAFSADGSNLEQAADGKGYGKGWRVADYDAASGTWSTPAATADSLANYGIKFTVTPRPITNKEHSADWEFVWDTSFVNNKAAAMTDVTVDLWVTDQKISSETGSGVTSIDGLTTYKKPKHVEYTINADDGHPATLRLDVVPYITGLKTALFAKGAGNGMGQTYARTAKGHWPVFYHRDSTGTAGSYVGSAEQFTVEGFNLGDLVDPAKGGWPTSKTQSGWLTATVGGVPSLNNINDNAAALSGSDYANAYNRQPNGKNNDNLTDDVYIDVWQINGKAATYGSLTINEPVMKINPANGMIGVAFKASNSNNTLVMPGSDNSYQYYHQGHDSKNTISMAYDDSGHSFAVNADADSGTDKDKGVYADSFTFHSSLWGKTDAERIQKPATCMQLDMTGQKGDKYGANDFIFNGEILKQQSPSIATAGDHVFIAYYDAFNKEIRFRSTLGGVFATNTDKNTGVGNFKSLNRNIYDVKTYTYEESLKNCQILATSDSTAAAGNYVGLAALPGASGDVAAIVWYDTANNKLWYSYNTKPNIDRTGMTTTAATHTVAKGATYKLPDDELPSNVKRKSAVAKQGTHYIKDGNEVRMNTSDKLRVDTEKTYSLAAGAGKTLEIAPGPGNETVSTVKYKSPYWSEAEKDTHYTLSGNTYTAKAGVASLRFETQKAYEIKAGQTFSLSAGEALSPASPIRYHPWSEAVQGTHYTLSGNTYTAKAGALLFDINKTYALAKDGDTFSLPSGEVLSSIQYYDGSAWNLAEKGVHYLSEDGTYTDKVSAASRAAVQNTDYTLAGNAYTAIAELLQFDFNKTYEKKNIGDTFSLSSGEVLTGNIEYKVGDVWQAAVRDTHYTLSDEGIYTTRVANVRFTVKKSSAISKGQKFTKADDETVTRITSIANLRFLVKTSRAIGKYGTFKLAAGEELERITYYDVWSPAAIDTDYTLSEAEGKKTYTAKAERLQFDFDKTHVLENQEDTVRLHSGDVLTGNIEYKDGDVWKTAVRDTHYTLSADGTTYTAKVANVRLTVKTSRVISKDETFREDASVNVTRITYYSGDTWADAVKGAQYKLSNAGVYTAKTDLLFETIKSYETSGSFTVPAGETVLSVKRQDFDAGYDLMDAVEGQHYTCLVEPKGGYTDYTYNAMAPLVITTKKYHILDSSQPRVNISGETLKGVVLVDGTSDAVKGVDYTLSDNGVYTAITDELTINTRKLPAGKVNSQTGADADGWSKPVSLFGAKVGMYCKIAFDAKGGVHIAAYDSNSGSLWYAYLSDYKKPGEAKINRVDTGMVGHNLDLDVALDSTGEKALPCISYYALGENMPKFARLANAGTFGDGIENGKYTGTWDVSYVPTDSPLVRDNTSVGLWKQKLSAAENAGVIKDSTTGQSKNGDSGKCYGNGSQNAVVGYKNIDKESVTKGYFETAQLTGNPQEAY